MTLVAGKCIGSFAEGFARNEVQSAFPTLWKSGIAFWCPSVGMQCRVLQDFYSNRFPGTPAGIGSDFYQPGPYGGALLFAGSGSYACTNCLELFESRKTLSLVTWMKRTASGNTVAIGIGTDSGLTKHVGIDLDATTVRFNMTDASDAWGKFAINDLAWHCYGFSYDGNGAANSDRLKGYVDGRPVALTFTGTIPSASMGATSGTLYIGKIIINSVTTQSNGRIGDTFAYTRALTPAEHRLFAQGFSPLMRKKRPPITKAAAAVAGQPAILRTKTFMPTGFARVGHGWN